MSDQTPSQFLDSLQRQGRYGFDRRELEIAVSLSTSSATKALNRLAKKDRVRKIRKGFHVIIPVEFSAKGMIPPDWFIDDLLRYLDSPYYIGLQSAAAYHGAAHQQIQEFQVVCPRQERPVELPQLTIRFFRKLDISTTKTQFIKSHSGMLPVSTPESTALDLVRYSNRIGGADSVLTILQELAESMNPEMLKEAASAETKLAPLQRLGWFLDKIEASSLADSLFSSLGSRHPLSRAKLAPTSPWEASPSSNRWRIIENVQPESDL